MKKKEAPRSLTCMDIPFTKMEQRTRKCAWRWCAEDLKFGWGPSGVRCRHILQEATPSRQMGLKLRGEV